MTLVLFQMGRVLKGKVALTALKVESEGSCVLCLYLSEAGGTGNYITEGSSGNEGSTGQYELHSLSGG